MEYLIGYRNLFFLFYYYPVNGSVFQICDFFSLSYIEVFMLEKNIVELLLTLALYEMLWTRQSKYNMVSIPKELPEQPKKQVPAPPLTKGKLVSDIIKV